jgi:hypothetical protein
MLLVILAPEAGTRSSMKASHLRSALAALAALAGLVLLAPSAAACSIPSCTFLFALPAFDPREGQQIPANAVAFELRIDPGAARSVLIELRSVEDGQLVPASIKQAGGDWVFAPNAPLEPEKQYLLRYDGRCLSGNGGATGALLVNEFRFFATQPAPYPTSLGQLMVVEEGFEYPGRSTRVYFARLGITFPEFYSFRNLTRFSVEVDGKPENLADTGEGSSNLHGGLFELQAICSQPGVQRNSCGDLESVLPGRHRIKVSADFVGTDADPSPVFAEVDLTCDKLGPNAPEPALCSELPSFGVMGQPPFTQSLDPLCREDSAAGCSVGRSFPAGTLPLALLILALARKRLS